MNLTPIKRHTLEIGQPSSVHIILAGCGGTGSFAALHLARLAYEARRAGLPVNLVFVDPDQVEEANIGRQNFAPCEVGLFKAAALASRYNLAFGLEISAVCKRFGEAGLVKLWTDHFWQKHALLLIVGCVDSPAAREEIADAVSGRIRSSRDRRIWWLDAGNDEHSGQVLLGNSLEDGPAIDPTLGCVGLPLPMVQEPALVEPRAKAKAKAETETELSCAELLALNVQSLMINQAMAGWIGVYASRLILSHDLDIYQTWVDLAGGNVRSVAITGEAGKIEVGKVEAVEIDLAGPPALTGGAVGHCPECGELIFEGRDTIVEEVGEDDTVFCPACGWQLYLDAWEEFQAEAV